MRVWYFSPDSAFSSSILSRLSNRFASKQRTWFFSQTLTDDGSGGGAGRVRGGPQDASDLKPYIM